MAVCIRATAYQPGVPAIHYEAMIGIAAFRVMAQRAGNVSISLMHESEVYPLIGEDGFLRLVAAFYRHVAQDDILGPMYPRDDMAGAEQRMRDFLVFRFGGPPHYLERRGHPRLRMRHAPFAIDQAARDRWMALMDKALVETALPTEAEQTMRAFFDSTATFMINRQ